MIRNRNLAQDAKKHKLVVPFDISEAVTGGSVVDQLNDIKVTAIDFVYRIATDAGTVGESIQVGIAGALTQYLTAAPTASQAQGVVQSKTVASTALVPKGTALLVTKSAYSGQTNTGEVDVVVTYEYVDRSETRP